MPRRAELVNARERRLERYGDAATGCSDSAQSLLMISSRSNSARPPVAATRHRDPSSPQSILNRSAIYIGLRTHYGMSAPSPGRAAT